MRFDMRPAPARARGTIRKITASALAGPEARLRPGSGEQLTAVLADGMGGHAGGALASGLRASIFLAAYATSSGEVPARLAEALELANAAIAHEVDENPALSGMGCTLIGATFGPPGDRMGQRGRQPPVPGAQGRDRAAQRGPFAGTGDRQARRGRQDQLGAAAHADPRRHFLRSALTGTEIDLIDRSHRPLALAAWRRGDPGQRRHPHHLPRRDRESGRLRQRAGGRG